MSEPMMNHEPDGETGGGDSATAVREKQPKKAPAPAPARVDRLPPFRVILHNDDTNDMDHVVETVIELTPHNRMRAVEIMFMAHMRGRAMLLVTHRERAELYMDQFRSRRLTVTIERSD